MEFLYKSRVQSEKSSILHVVVSNHKIVHFYSDGRIQSEEFFKDLNLPNT